MSLTDDLIRRSCSFERKSVDEATRTMSVVASTDALDAYDDIVEQDWDLGRYKKNPVVLYGHNASGGWFSGPSAEETLPIGFARNVSVVDGKLEADLVFVDAAANPMAEKVWQGAVQGSLRAVSVGFKSRDIVSEKQDDKMIYRLRSNELFEISVVPMGANPEAVAKSANDQLRRLAAQQAQVRATEPGMDPKELLAKAERLEVERDAAKEKATDLERKLAERDAAHAKDLAAVTAERDAAKAQVAELEADLAETEVDALVGKQIMPAEREEFLELRLSNPALFTKMVEKRADTQLTARVAGDGATDRNKAGGASGAGADLVAAAKAKAAKKGR